MLNLAVNARDAMPHGGGLSIETSNIAPAEGFMADGGRARRVRLCIADTGVGIETAALDHIFEPFFSTKEAAGNSGLGLATVYGIVQQMGGTIDVWSEIGRGTRFTLEMACAEVAPTAPRVESETAVASEASETVLLVEDSEALRGLIVRQLSGAGYRVLAAASPTAALELTATTSERIDLLLTDVELPGMSGPELAEVLAHRLPGLRSLYMSGYSAQIIATRDAGEFAFLQKPFSKATLLEHVRAALRAPGGSAPT